MFSRSKVQRSRGRRITQLLRPLAMFPLAGVALTSAALAQIPLAGNVSDSTVGPLLSGTVYTVVASVTVPTGATLTIQPGAIVKFAFDTSLTVQGTLLCNGVGPDSVWFTDIRDDSVGGDTNGDGGASLPSANWWRGVDFEASSSGSAVHGLTVRYGGRYIAGFNLRGASPTLADCRALDIWNHGFDLHFTSGPTLTRCEAVRCVSVAFEAVPLSAVPGFSGLAASGNGRNWASIGATTVPAGVSLTIGPGNGVNGGLYFPGGIQVASTGTLTLQAGMICKFGYDQSVDVQGDLHLQGTAAQPVWLTDERDDGLGGDWNADGGASLPAANWWRGVLLRDMSSGSILEYARVRFGGRYIAGIELAGSNAVVRDTIVSDHQNHGINLSHNSAPTLQNVEVLRCASSAFANVPLQALAGFSGLAASGNGRNWIDVTSATVAPGTSVAIGPENLLQGAFHTSLAIAVQPGGVLTLRAGTICKMAYDTAFIIEGRLHTQGTSGQPVWITDERDDAVGGDSNTDAGASLPGPNWWRGVQMLDSSDGSSLVYTNLRYGGRYYAALDLHSAAVSVERCRITDIHNVGLNCHQNTELCTFTLLRFERCALDAIDGVELRRIGDFVLPSGAGNVRDRLVVRGGTVTGAVTVAPENQFNGSLFFPSGITIQAGATLNLQPGVALKMGYDTSIQVLGALSVRGGLTNPVVVTNERDDSVGGDSNGDGAATLPAPNWWRGIEFNSIADLSIVLGLDVRYGGRYIPNINVLQPTAILREVRSSFCATNGFHFLAHPIVLNRLVAYGNQGDGVYVEGGAFDLRQLTSVANGGYGVRGGAGWSGGVVDSITWGNGAGPTTGLTPSRVRYSDGDAALAGSNGNIFADPLFVDGAHGDLRLGVSSPCINSGDPASPYDPDATRADMGAYFFNHYEPTVFCSQTVFPPCTPSLAYAGFASLSSPAPFSLRLNSAPTQSFAFFFYGIGPAASIPGTYGTLCVGGPYQRLAPVPAGGDPLDGPCAGRFEIDFNAYLRGGTALGVVVGSNVIGHFWYRYSAAPGFAAFSQAIAMPVGP